jgi:NAD(P)-dependent dehydrogenase (short-subunit alcohol dehydrogenase family)
MELAGRTAVVIGGGGGVGRGVALGLAAAGMRVMVADLDAGAAATVAAELRERGAEAAAQQVDATDVASLEHLASAAVDAFGAVHVLANLVGVITNRRLDEATEADWAWFFEFNVMAHVRANNVFLPHLRAHGEPAHIMNTSSMAGLVTLGPELVGGFNNGPYTTTKHALIGYCTMLRMELAPEGIGVSVLCPGLVAGNLSATSSRNRPERFGGPLPNPREGMPVNPRAMPNDQVGPIVARAIAANRMFVFTHPEAAFVDARHEQMHEDFAFLRDAAE